jgi:hypothetical protein
MRDRLRERFEEIVKAAPYEQDIRRFPDDESSAWPGVYRHVSVDLAWNLVEDMQPKCNEVAAVVNELRDIAVEYHGAQQLRERIAEVVRRCAAGEWTK